ncbi:MAG: chaperone NapD [Methylobacter sp.]
MSKLNIVGILVSAFPEYLDAIHPQLEALGAQVHLRDEQGKLVVTLEEENDRTLADTLVQIQDIEGVINAAMVYHGIDDTELA